MNEARKIAVKMEFENTNINNCVFFLKMHENEHVHGNINWKIIILLPQFKRPFRWIRKRITKYTQ